MKLRIFIDDDSLIERVDEYKYLGLWLDEKLSCKPHIALPQCSVPDCGGMGLPPVKEYHLDISALRLPPMITSHVFPVRQMPPHTITLPPP